MKKNIVLGGVVGLIGLLLVTGITNAGSEPPLIERIIAVIKALNEKVASLQDEVAGIQQPMVRDANGITIGVLLGNQGDTNADGFQINYGTIEVYDINYDVTARLNAFSGQAIIDHNFGTKFLLFPTPDCTGQAYVSNVNGTEFGEILNNTHTLVVRAKSSGDELYVGNTSVGTVTDLSIQSRLLPSDDCNPIAQIYPLATAVDPITLPYVGPLEIVLE